MKVYPDKLQQNLQRGIAPVYLLYGEEPLAQKECSDRLRRALNDAGFEEREVVFALEDADWTQVRHAHESLSLFAAQRVVDIRLPSGKPGRVGSAVLAEIAKDPPPDIVTCVTAGRLERAQLNSAWFKAIDKVGVVIPVAPLSLQQLPAWITQRMKAAGLRPEPAAVALIAARVEGNMLAADQEIERLSLLFPNQEITEADVMAAVGNSARYAISDCVEAALAGVPSRAITVLEGLQAEGEAPMLILWSLTQEIRAGARVAQSVAAGMSPAAAFKAAGVWRNREAALSRALKRHNEQSWIRLLAMSVQADRILKGHSDGDLWQTLSSLTTGLAGVEPPVPLHLET